jgi:uncharacterized repeat protein (TIGR03803 family)
MNSKSGHFLGSVSALALLVAMIPAMATAQTFKVLYNFGTVTSEPFYPYFPTNIALGRDGNFYSTMGAGGSANQGGVIRITSAGAVTVGHSFDSLEGQPLSGLILGSDGNFYGTTQTGGTSGLGTVFRITPAGTFTVLHNFTGAGTDGSTPYPAPIQAADGNFYGTTIYGGSLGHGTIYKITPGGTLTTLYQFDGIIGSQPSAQLTQGTDGNFYGTTLVGGPSGAGIVFRMTPAGKLTSLHNFDITHGNQPESSLLQGTDGNFYGTAGSGGTTNGGAIFKITPAGVFTILHYMNGTTDGNQPSAGLIQATDGNLYGATTSGGSSNLGTIFEVTPNGAYSVLHNFDGTTGSRPVNSLVQSTNGTIYGEAQEGGSHSEGTFFSWSAPALTPFAGLVSTSGKVGKTIGILGQGFTGTSTVSFNGVPATFKVLSATFLTAVVPSGAITGSVTVTRPGGILTSSRKFRVTPQITSFDPITGSVGTTVTITGVSLTGATSVTFGGVKSTSYTVNSDAQITATVPAGAVTGKIVVRTSGGSATSPTSFTVTP